MFVNMSKRAKPLSVDAKVVVYARIDPHTVGALDEICDSMRPKPSRAQLIDAACAEYVERYREANPDRRGRARG